MAATIAMAGVNAAMLVKGGSVTTIKGAKITSNAKGANGVFLAWRKWWQKRRSGRWHDSHHRRYRDYHYRLRWFWRHHDHTGGGVTKAKNLSVCTSGLSSAPIRTDRGGVGIVTVEGGSHNSATDLALPLSALQPT